VSLLLASLIMLVVVRTFIKNHLIAHAMGSIYGLKYTNSLEAFKKSYMLGFRKFEVDVTLTSDNKVVCFHRYSKKIYDTFGIKSENFSYDEFKSGKLLENSPYKFTTLDLDDVLKIMSEYKNIKMVFHIQSNIKDEIQSLINEIKFRSLSLSLSNRIIFQPNMYFEDIYLEKKNDIEKYMVFIRKDEICDIPKTLSYLDDMNIRYVTVNKKFKKYLKQLKKHNNLYVQVWTEDNIFKILKYLIRGQADAIVTNAIFTL